MKTIVKNNLDARRLQIKLYNTDQPSHIYNTLSERYNQALEELPPEGKMVGQNGFLIPWRSE